MNITNSLAFQIEKGLEPDTVEIPWIAWLNLLILRTFLLDIMFNIRSINRNEENFDENGIRLNVNKQLQLHGNHYIEQYQGHAGALLCWNAYS